MCKVIVKDSERNVEFIIYNHLFSKDTSYRFTVTQLVTELKQYELELSSEYVEEEVNTFIKSGLVNQNFRCFSVCSR